MRVAYVIRRDSDGLYFAGWGFSWFGGRPKWTKDIAGAEIYTDSDSVISALMEWDYLAGCDVWTLSESREFGGLDRRPR